MAIFKKIIFILVLLLTFSIGAAALAQEPSPQAPSPQAASGRIAGPQGLFTGVSDGCYKQGDCSLCDVVAIVNSIIKLMLGIVGTAALAAFVWAGINILMAKSRISYFNKAKDIIKYAIIGLILVFFSYAMVNFGLNVLVGSSQPDSGKNIYSSPAKLFGETWTDLCVPNK